MSRIKRDKMGMIDYNVEFNRLIENFWQEKKGSIRNRQDFDREYDDYIIGHETKFTKNSREAMWQSICGKPQITRKTDVTIKKREQPQVKTRYLNIRSKVKNQYVYSEKTEILRRQKKIVVYRDARGRFAKLVRE